MGDKGRSEAGSHYVGPSRGLSTETGAVRLPGAGPDWKLHLRPICGARRALIYV